MTIQLEEYNKKRNFGITAEPEGGAAEPAAPAGNMAATAGNLGTSESNAAETEGQLRFVVQHHAARSDHYDFRLEWDGALLSWAVPKGPSYNTRDKRLAVQVEDHPLEYRNFEGTIPKGEYGGGVVMLWDEGYWEPQTDFDVAEGLSKGSLKFVLKGRRLKGKWALVKMKGRGENNWLLIKERDEYAKTGDENGQNTHEPPEFSTSIRTGRTMAEIEAGQDEKITRNPFHEADVQLAKLAGAIPAGENWLYEMKYDGYRILAYLEGSEVRLMTRNSNDYTMRFQDVAYSLLDWASGRAMVLDGEMVITDAEGRTDFQALQNYMKNPQGRNLTYIVFDLLALNGEDLRGQPLTGRKAALEALMKDAPGNLHYSQHVEGNGKVCFQTACQSNMEGIVGKRADSVYSGTRNGDWIKLKCDKRQEFVIGGYTLTDKKTSGVSSLLLGVYEGEDLVYAGRAGTGFTERTMKELEERFRSIKREASPFMSAPGARKNEIITWLEPELVAEIKFAEWTEDHLVRQASFKGLRTDKDPRDIKREMTAEEAQSKEGLEEAPSFEEMPSVGKAPAGKELESTVEATGNTLTIAGIKITNPDKVIFEEPAITKGDVVRYYAKVSERMMPYVAGRILSIVRCPKGISQSCFFKKHPGPDNKAIVTIPVVKTSGETEEYFYIQNVTGLIYEAQMGTLEFHPWGSRVENLEKPDMMVFDLDPDEGMSLETVRQGVRDVKSILEQLSLKSYLKTSGGKGYHVVVPFTPTVDWEAFHDFAKRIAEVMEQQWPDRYTSNVRKANRKNRIFIDWIRNGRGATSIAPYSIRARNGARVSMPIAWKELDTVAPDGVDMAEALARIEGDDPWDGFFQTDQRLK